MQSDGITDASTAVGLRRRGEQRSTVVTALTIVSHPTARRAGDTLLLDGRATELTRNAPDFLEAGSLLGAPLGDPFVSRKPIRLVAVENGGVRVVAGEGGTPLVIGGEPLREAMTIGAEQIARGVAIELADRVVLLLHHAEPDVAASADALGMVGQSAALRRVRAQIERVVDLAVPVLVRGETGTGKELVARAIHERGPRRDGPFVSVNLGAIPRELAAAELFGAQRGAYTGAAQDRPGFFRTARGGTLFLDEVGEASPEVQVMLLRVLETGEMYPVGGQSPVATDVRVLAATDADLEERIRDGRFKAPLLHRLAGYEIRLPPLRERREDIGVLFVHFAREELESIGELHRLSPRDPYAEPWLPAALATRLLQGAWPGNIRQLRNVTRQLVIGSRGRARLEIDPRLAHELEAGGAPPSGPAAGARAAGDSGIKVRRKPSDVSEAELVAAMRGVAWDLKAAADRIGIPRPSIYDLIDKSPTLRTAGDIGAEEIARCFEACGGDVEAMVERLQVSARALKRRIKELGLGVKRA
jgi:two-component system, NtrC family, nitrogen regulation response regulator GlnG